MAALDERRLAAGRRSAGRAAAGLGRSPGSDARRAAGPAGAGAASATLPSRAAAPPPVVLRLRVGEAPLPLPQGGAYCLRRAGGRRSRGGRPLPRASCAPPASPVRAAPARGPVRRRRRLARRAARAAVGTRSSRAAPASCRGLTGAFVTEYPLQGLNGLAAGVAAGLAGRSPAAVIASPEASLEEIAAWRRRWRPRRRLGPGAAGRRDPRLRPPAGAAHARPAGPGGGALRGARPGRARRAAARGRQGLRVPGGGGRGRHARLQRPRHQSRAATSTSCARPASPPSSSCRRRWTRHERAAFAAGGLRALAPLASRERSTTGHLFRGVA